MCGILAILNGKITDRSPYWDQHGLPIDENTPESVVRDVSDRTTGYNTYENVFASFMKGRMRGPESSKLEKIGMHVLFGFHRLAINGLNPESDQPITHGDIHLICNGEIYNYRELYSLMGTTPNTGSDCEVIIHLYKKYGIEQTLTMLDGVFAFVLLDQSVDIEHPVMYVARDPYGVRPLYMASSSSVSSSSSFPYYTTADSEPDNEIIFSSELKMMYREDTSVSLQNAVCSPRHFPPGTFSEFYLTHGIWPTWRPLRQEVAYFTPRLPITEYPGLDSRLFSRENILTNIRFYLLRAVEKRCQCTERPIACLLSGGLDSSLITAIVSNYRYRNGLPPVETYSIGLQGSEDLKYAKIVAEHLGTNHTEIVVPESEFLDAIPEVVHAIESYDTTTVRASIGNYLLGKYIAAHSSAKVIFNGDGSDELMGGYLYMKACPDAIEFDRETRRLLREIHAFDVLRSDKSISSHGLEPRTPFLDRDFTQYYLSIPAAIRRGTPMDIEKQWLREAFSPDTAHPETYIMGGLPYLPDSILWRRKEAFSDGITANHAKSRSLYQIIQDHAETVAGYKVFPSAIAGSRREKRVYVPEQYRQNMPKTSEQLYYRKIFESHYPDADILGHFWMPKYVEATDASARTLELYTHCNAPVEEPDLEERHVEFSERVSEHVISRHSESSLLA